jgi:hypothetical protein
MMLPKTRFLFSTINISYTGYLDLANNVLLSGSLTSEVVKKLSNLREY